jgi:Uma2 family endonuclease
MATAEALLTAEEFGRRTDPGYPEELVQGRIIAMPPPQPRHGQVCKMVIRILDRYVDEHDLGHVLSNDSGIITERDPDTVRGADISFYSYQSLPKGPIPAGYLAFPPNLVVEVCSPDDRWREILVKVNEYLEVGVTVVVVLDPEPRTAHIFRADRAPQQLGADDDLTVPEILGDFRVELTRFFE